MDLNNTYSQSDESDYHLGSNVELNLNHAEILRSGLGWSRETKEDDESRLAEMLNDYQKNHPEEDDMPDSGRTRSTKSNIETKFQ
jgi:hypothetical protein